jgi:Ricin-type beta-trefoil lectin domain-like
MHVRRKTAGVMLAAAAAVGLTTAAAVPASASTTGSSNCLDVPGASKQAGLGVQIYTCNGTAAQAWAIAGPVA